MVTSFAKRLEAETSGLDPKDLSSNDTGASALERLDSVAVPNSSDRCKTAILLWEDTFRRTKWLQNLMVTLAAGTVGALLVTTVIALVQSSAAAGISGAVGTVVTGSGAVFVNRERNKSLKLLGQYTRDRRNACS